MSSLVGDLLPGGKIGATTEEDGRFRLDGLPTGEYQLSVTHIGYRTLTREGVGIVAGERELMLTLETGIIFLDQKRSLGFATAGKSPRSPGLSGSG